MSDASLLLLLPSNRLVFPSICPSPGSLLCLPLPTAVPHQLSLLPHSLVLQPVGSLTLILPGYLISRSLFYSLSKFPPVIFFCTELTELCFFFLLHLLLQPLPVPSLLQVIPH